MSKKGLVMTFCRVSIYVNIPRRKKTFLNDALKNVFDERKSDLDELHLWEWRSDIGRWRGWGKSFLEECALAQWASTCNGSAMAVQWLAQHSGKNSASAQWKPASLGVIRKDLSLFGCSILERAGILGYITLHWLLLEKLVSTSKCALQSRKNPCRRHCPFVLAVQGHCCIL